MQNLTRWEPMREMRQMHDALDRLFDQAFFGRPFFDEAPAARIPIDLIETDDELIVKATAPGLKGENIKISISGDILKIQTETSREGERQEARDHLRERRFVSYSRSISLPAAVDGDQASAEFENGVLTLTIPKLEETRPKTITVKPR